MVVLYFIVAILTILVLINFIVWIQTYKRGLVAEAEEEEEECSHDPEKFSSWTWGGGVTIDLLCNDCDEWITRPFEDLPHSLQMKARKARLEQYHEEGEDWKGGDGDILLKE